MPRDVSPIRSLLFVPGNRADWVDSARASGADAVVFDLEDSVPSSDKDRARAVVRAAIDEHGRQRPALLVRVTETSDSVGLRADLDAVVAPGLTGVLLPQVVGVHDVVALDRLLTERERAAGLARGAVVVDPLLETPQSLLDAHAIATCTPRVAYMGAGVSRRGDIARRMGYRWTPQGLETLYFRSKVLLEMRAAGVPNPLSGMWGEIADLVGLRSFADQTRDLGYAGMMVLHPTHVAVVNEVFTPDAHEVALWQEILVAMEEATRAGRGAIRLRGEIVDDAHVKTARDGLARATAFGLV
ncbi:MAG: HpcH/HpaI aldolase/citrate lyase family protein [Acidimicrobiales bacterium]